MDNFILKQNSFSIHPELPAIQLLAYKSEYYFDRLYEDFNIEYPLLFTTWKRPRKAQFLAGRIAIQSAFKRLNILPETVGIGAFNEPVFPINLTGSISHQNQFSIACVLKTNKGVGLDVQTLLNEEELTSCETVVLTHNDDNLTVDGLTRQQLISLIFSAKESFFKASFKSVSRYFDFDAVSVHSIDIHKQQLVLLCETALSKNLKKGDKTIIQFCYKRFIQTDVVVCYCVL